MKLFEVVIEIVVGHPIFGIVLAFLLGTLIFAVLKMNGWAIACFAAAVVFGLIALYAESKGNSR